MCTQIVSFVATTLLLLQQAVYSTAASVPAQEVAKTFQDNPLIQSLFDSDPELASRVDTLEKLMEWLKSEEAEKKCGSRFGPIVSGLTAPSCALSACAL